MSEKTKRILSIAYIFFTIALVFVLGIWMGDIGASWEALISLSPGWVLGALGCWVAYVVARGLAMKFFCDRQGFHLRTRDALRIAMLGQYYSGITPASTGGQPFQIYELNKCGVPVGAGSSVMITKFICFQIALMLLAGGLWIYFRQQVQVQLESWLWFVWFGFGLNTVWTCIILLVVFKQSIVKWLMKIVVSLGRKMHLIRDPEQFVSRVDAQLTEFQRAFRMLIKEPLILLTMLGFALFQVLAYMSTIYFLYRGFGLSSVEPGFILTLQLLLFISVAFMPMPGASGAQEGGFVVFFRGIFPEGSMFAALLAWRFFTYYLTLIVGAGVVIVSTFVKKRRNTPELLPDGEASPGKQ